MCTVTFLPRPNGFIMASNRDEHVLRPYALPPELHHTPGGRIAFPKDGLAGGTWIALHERGDAMVLLNGAFAPHVRQPAYRLSRGLIFLDIFGHPEPAQGFLDIDLTDIEPFTLALFAGGRLWDLRWDGQQKHHVPLDAGRPHIWSSAMLYTEAVRRQRETWFREWLLTIDPETVTPEEVHRFHRFGGAEARADESLVMSRDHILKTVSITVMERREEQLQLWYEDLAQEKETHLRLS